MTTYSYDENNKLSNVSVAVPGVASQSRSFSYDNRGFLQSETHPETGTTFYGTYDSRGHARDERTGAAGGFFDLRTFYDRAERVTGIYYVFPTMTDPNNLRPLKLFTYDMGQTATNFTRGKLVQAVRHNYIDRIAWDAIVTENYTYGGKDGAMSRRNTNVLHGPNSSDANNFMQSFEYNDLGLVSKLTYPSATAGDLLGKGPSRDVFYDYTNGYLTNLRNGTTSVASFNYHANGLTSSINYSNGVIWSQGNDPNSMPRTGSISATGMLLPNGAAATYNLGQFSYDGRGNIKGVGTDRYAYDYLGRLKKGRLTALNGSGWSQEYSYDNFGNLTFVRTIDSNGIPTDRSIPVSGSTNRLTSASYDSAGNQTSSGNYTYGYDSLNMLQSFQEGANQDVIYFYTPNDERIFTGNIKGLKITWSLRDLSGNVLREWVEQSQGGVWNFSWTRDYFNNGRRSLAEANPNPLPGGMIYYVHDHLGSVRATFNQDRIAIENHTYLPFGEEAIFTTSSTTPKSFTGHERDLNSSTTKDDDLIYMHARYYNPRFGRFLSADPITNDLTNGSAGWSRYSYAGNNPIRNIDSTGNYREDFHYDLTNSLARATGFSQQNAQSIAAATQGSRSTSID